MDTYEGPERRKKDDVYVRLALLEKGQTDTERRHRENKESLQAVHRRITELKKDFSDTLNNALNRLIEKMEEKEKECKDCRDEVTTLKTHHGWLYAWISAAWLAICGIGGWIFHVGAKK